MSAESGLPPVDPEVLDRACDAAWKACWPEFPHRPGSTGDRHIRRALESAGPIVAAAAYRQGREGLEARIEKARRLLIELEQSVDAGAGLIPANILEPRLNEIFAALSEYRDETEGE